MLKITESQIPKFQGEENTVWFAVPVTRTSMSSRGVIAAES